jgi:hypothetical protein
MNRDSVYITDSNWTESEKEKLVTDKSNFKGE